MLDTEPTDNESTSTDGAAPAKKAARKAPAKRAPRKTAAQKAAEAEAASLAEQPLPAAEPLAEPPAAEPVAEAPEVKPKKATRPRKAAAKKIAPAVELAPETPAEPVAEVTEPTDAPTAPAKRTPRKRVSKAAAAAAAAEPETTPVVEPAEPEVATAPNLGLPAPTVLFQPPTETQPTTRRRRSAKSPVVDTAAKAAEPTAEQEDLLSGDVLEIDSDAVIDSAPVESTLPEPADADDTTDAEAETEEGDGGDTRSRRRRRGRRGRGSRSGDDQAEVTPTEPVADVEDDDTADTEDEAGESDHADEVAEAALSASARRRRRRRRSTGADADAPESDDPPNTVVHVRDSGRASGDGGGGRERNRGGAADEDGVRGVKGSTRLEAKRQRRRDNRDSGRKRAPILTEAEFLARREAVDRVMAVRQTGDRTQIAVLEDDILVEHYVTRASASSAVGNVYLGRVQNVLPSMEAAFIDIGRGRNGVLYAGEVNWDSAGLEGKARSIENALNPGDTVLVQVTKDPIGHKGARLTSQVSLPGRFVVYVPGGGMTGISRKLPDVERTRLKAILKKVVPDEAGVIVRTAAEGATEEDLVSDVERLKTEWESISRKAEQTTDGPTLVHGEPDLAIRVVRDIFNDDFSRLVIAGSDIHATISGYVSDIAPDLADRIHLHTGESDLFRDLRVDEQLMKALDRKVWLPSGGSLVIDRTEAMTVVDVNTGKYTGSGGNLEQTVTRNNLEAAEEIVRQLRLRDIGGIVVIDFIDMVLESNRDLVLRRLTECLGRDRTKHQVAEVTSLGLVQMTRKRVGEGLLEAFSEPCEHCKGRGVIVHLDPVEKKGAASGWVAGSPAPEEERSGRGGRRGNRKAKSEPAAPVALDPAEIEAENEKRRAAASAIAVIAAATNGNHQAEESGGSDEPAEPAFADAPVAEPVAESAATSEPSPVEVAEPVEPTVPAKPARGRNSRSHNAPKAAPAEPAVDEDRFPTEDPTLPAAPARPRRRRAASRPAGPPVPVTTAGS